MEKSRGFSLIELTVSIGVFLLALSAVFHVLGKYQKSYEGEQIAADLHQGVRSATELISQEVAQAGTLGQYVGPASRQLAADVTGDTAAQKIELSSTGSIFVGEKLLVDAGANQELVTVTGVDGTSVTGIFAGSHVIGAPVNVLGAFTNGILPTSTATQLQIFGDINANGSLAYVEYNCDFAAGTVTRSITAIPAAIQDKPRVLVRNLVPNPGATPCFQYRKSPVNGTTLIEVWVTLSTQSGSPDPETKQYRTITTSVVATARNVLAALDLAKGMPDRVQPTPSGLPLPKS